MRADRFFPHISAALVAAGMVLAGCSGKSEAPNQPKEDASVPDASYPAQPSTAQPRDNAMSATPP